jgi:hypothetical protein
VFFPLFYARDTRSIGATTTATVPDLWFTGIPGP